MSKIIPLQESLRRVIPEVFGCEDYRKEEELMERIDRILSVSGLEDVFLEECLKEKESREEQGKQRKASEAQDGASARQQKEKSTGWGASFLRNSRNALRCNILKHCLGLSFRELSKQLAMSPLYQWFCRLENFERIEVPSKSTLQKYSVWLSAASMKKILNKLTDALADKERATEIGIENELDVSTAWVDSTCLKANIHFPTDWVLLKDAAKTLLKSIAVIRKHGLVHRIGSVKDMARKINTICMEITAAGRKKAGGKKERKEKLRKLDRLSKIIELHGKRYRQLLDLEWSKTDLSRREAEVILRRMDNVLEQLPEARRQARERILGERQVNNSEKILSLYERNLHVIVRRKAGAEVEFGSSLFVVENAQGFIIDHELLKEDSPGDGAWLSNRVEELKEITGGLLKAVVGDRGFATQAVSKKLAQENIIDLLCPRNPKTLAEKLQKDEKFAEALNRRAQTEGRIGILKNMFLEGVPRSKGYANRSMQVAWAVLSHNLWVAARMRWKQKEVAVAA